MIDQEEEYRQMALERDIQKHLDELYQLLRSSDRIEAEATLGFLAQAQAAWEDGDGG